MNTSKITVLAASLLALAATASAVDMSSVKISGFAAGSYQYAKTSGATGVDSLFGGATAVSGWGDAVKVAFSAADGPVSGTVSLFYVPNNAPSEIGILDAYLTYDLGGGWSLKGGKYLSPLGYEAFNIPDMIAITYGTTIYAVPGYHTGLEVDYTDKDWSAALGVDDSVYSPATKFFAGDDSLQGNKGIEGYVSYKGIENTVLWAGFANEGKGGPKGNTKSFTVLDFWASYQLTKEASVFAEVIYNTKVTPTSGSANAWETGVTYAFTDPLSATFRVSGGDGAFVPLPKKQTKYTISPAYKVTSHFTVRGELSLLDVAGPNTTFFGLQGVYTF